MSLVAKRVRDIVGMSLSILRCKNTSLAERSIRILVVCYTACAQPDLVYLSHTHALIIDEAVTKAEDRTQHEFGG
jgi:hypothetical protein